MKVYEGAVNYRIAERGGCIESVNDVQLEAGMKNELLLHPFTASKKSMRMTKLFSSIRIKQKKRQVKQNRKWSTNLND